MTKINEEVEAVLNTVKNAGLTDTVLKFDTVFDGFEIVNGTDLSAAISLFLNKDVNGIALDYETEFWFMREVCAMIHIAHYNGNGNLIAYVNMPVRKWESIFYPVLKDYIDNYKDIYDLKNSNLYFDSNTNKWEGDSKYVNMINMINIELLPVFTK